MNDIQDPRLLWIKGGLFVVLGVIAIGIIVLLTGNLAVFVATLIAIWAFCRAYYFAFYVIEHYIDDHYRFAGLTSLVNYWLSSARQPADERHQSMTRFVNAPALAPSRWSAIRTWLLLLFSPMAIAVIHFFSNSSSVNKILFNETLFVWNFAAIGTWLNLLSYWIVRGSIPAIWRLLVGCSSAFFAIFLFSTFSYTLSFLWENSLYGSVDLGILAVCTSFFLSSLAIHFGISWLLRDRLEDQLRPIRLNVGDRQMSIRFMLILTAVSAVFFLIVTRTEIYAPLGRGKIFNWSLLVSVAALLAASIMHVLVRWMLMKDRNRNALTNLMTLGWAVAAPIAMMLHSTWLLGPLSFDENTILCFISWGFLSITILVLYCLRRSGVFMTSA